MQAVTQSNRKVWQKIHCAAVAAARPVMENLEGRQLFAGDASIVQSLPFVLEFDGPAGGLNDKHGEGTGFTWVQPNKNNNEYQPNLIDLVTAQGVLNLTTAGSSTTGSNWEDDNTLVNALHTQFDATSGSFTIAARLKGSPNLSFIDIASEQGGIIFGPDQDNFVKLVALGQGSGGQFLQFIDEQKSSATTYTHSLNGASSMTNVGPFANIQTLDLLMSGDAATGKLTAFYRVNGGPLTKLSQEITLFGAKKDAFFSAAARAGVVAMHKNSSGPITVGFDRFEVVRGAPVVTRPTVTATRPADGTHDVPRDGFVAADVRLPSPGHGIDPATLNAASVRLYRTGDGQPVAANLNTSGGGDAIVLQPTGLLDAGTSYTFEVTDALRDTGGAPFVPFSMTFVTGTAVTPTDSRIAFEKVGLPTATGFQYTGLTVGPDGRLYAGTNTGLVHRFAINADGTLSAPQVINSVRNANGGARLVTGVRFDPASTADNLVLWVSHGESVLEGATDWTGKISRLSGANLEVYQDYVVNLPRSVRDHLTNQIDFGPDGALYVSQGSNTAMGAPDNAWGLRPERLLAAAILRLDTAAVAARIAANQGPLNAKTEEGGSYNPFAAGAPLTIYATGVRNAYDLVWHSNGQLYAPTNGSASGGNTPGYAGGTFAGRRIDQDQSGPFTSPAIPGLTDVRQTENDYLFRIERNGYYGHPNPLRGEFVLNGGNPTSGADYEEFTAYPAGTAADRNYRGAAYVFGKSYSPNGVIEYRGNAFNGMLDGRLLVARYSGGDDILVMTPGADGNIASTQSGIAGLTGFKDPLDLAMDRRNGNVYVSEYGASKLTLLRPLGAGANLSVSHPQVAFNAVRGSSATVSFRVSNTGTDPLALPSDGLTITGANAGMFTMPNKPALPLTIPAGGSVVVSLRFTAAGTTTIDIKTASLVIKSNDPARPVVTVPLRGLPTVGTGGQNEPSLQQVLNLHNIPLNVGDANPANTNLFSDAEPLLSPNDELFVQRLTKAGPGPVTVEPLAVFGVNSNPAMRFGWYEAGSYQAKKELFTVPSTTAQTVNPTVNGTTSFDPGDKTFGVYSAWPAALFLNPDGSMREVYSEDGFNTWETTEANRRKVRFYPLKNPDGSVVPDAYVMAHEEFVNATAGDYDNQDFVAIVRNVRPANVGPELGVENLDGLPFHNRFVFNRIQVQPPDPRTDPVTGERIQPPNNRVHDTATLRLRNTGTAPLTVSNLVLSSPAWQVVNMPAAGTQVAPDGSLDVAIKFVATGIPAGQTDNQTVGAAQNTGGTWEGTLTVVTDDADESNTVIQLAGWWQERNERNQEPSLPVLVNRIFGYGTTVLNPGQSLDQGGRTATVGEEVLSSYWQRADANRPVTVRQLAAYHTQGNTELVRSYARGSTSSTEVLTHDGTEGQSLLPHLASDPTKWAEGNVSASHVSGTSVFGLRVQSSRSDDSMNPQQQPGGGYGHQLRFFPLRDAEGNVVPNTFILAQDYYLADPVTGAILSNFDYQDNVYVVSNIRPAAPAAPQNVAASPAPGGLRVDWDDNTDPLLAGYNVYRGASATGSFTLLNTAGPVTGSEFLDLTAPSGATSFYRVRAVDTYGTESSNSAVVSATRPNDTVAPAVPTSLSADGRVEGVILSWTGVADADLAGYRVFRSDSESGTYAVLNGGQIISATAFTDTTAPGGATWFYRVAAVDLAGNESARSEVASAARPIPDTTPPAVPGGIGATGRPDGVLVSWGANTDADLAGYRVYRSSTLNGTYAAVNGGEIFTATSFLDTNTAPNQTWFYKVTSVDDVGNESARSAAVSAARADTVAPAAPGNFAAEGRADGIRLTWAANGESDLAGYRVYRAASPDGPFEAMNGGALVTGTSFLDASAQERQTWHYRLAAVDRSGNESAPTATAAATRPDLTAPAAPPMLTAAGGFGGVTLRWAGTGDVDLAGYNVYRAPAAGGAFVKLNAAGPLPWDNPAYDDTTATAGVAYAYRVTAVDFAGNESAPATANATRSVTSAPTLPLGGAERIGEGSVFRLTLGDVRYTGTPSVSQYVIRWGDGTSDVYTSGGVKEHVFADGSVIRDIAVDLVDAEQTYVLAGTFRLTVEDVAPAVQVSGAAAAGIGRPYRLDLSVQDPGQDVVSGWVIDWGDGHVQVVDGNPSEVTHSYDRAGRFTVKATATNEDGSFESNSLSVATDDMTAPTGRLDLVPGVSERGGQAYEFRVVYTDDIEMGSVDQAGAVVVRGPNGYAQAAAVKSVEGAGATRVVTYSITPPGGSWDAGDNGTYTVALQGGMVADAAGNAAAAGDLGTFAVGIRPQAPGSGLDAPLDLGTLGRKQKQRTNGTLGGEAGEVYYRFTTTEAMKLNAALSGLKGNADLELMDAVGNVLVSSAKPKTKSERVTNTLAAGTYVLRVRWADTKATPFKFQLVAKAPSKRDLIRAGLSVPVRADRA